MIKISIRIKNQLEIEHKLQNRIVSIYEKVKKEKLTHENLLNLVSEQLFSDKEYLKLPYHRRSFLNGFSQGLREIIYREHVLYYHEYNGKLYRDWNELPEEAKELQRKGKLNISQHSNFYWIGTNIKFS